MRLRSKADDTTIATISNNHNMSFEETVNDEVGMSIDEAISLVGEIISDEHDPRFDAEDDNVIIYGKRYRYDDLELWPDVDVEAARELGRECAESIDDCDLGDDWESDAEGYCLNWGFFNVTQLWPRCMFDAADDVNPEAQDAWDEGFREAWESKKHRVTLKEIPTDCLIRELHWRCENGTDGYLAIKVWHKDDVANELEAHGFAPSEQNVNAVVNQNRRTLKCLADCTDEDWEIISEAIQQTKELEKAKEKKEQE